jgi:hypothetical protein
MTFTRETPDFSFVKKAPLALQAKGQAAETEERRSKQAGTEDQVPGSKHVLSECEGSRSLAGSGQALNH